MTDRALLLFTKPAIPGRVKTRLAAGGVGAEAAAALHAAFLDDLVARFAAGGIELLPCWELSADEALPSWPPGGVRQEGSDLGARLHRAFRVAEERHPALRFVAAIGTDCPDLPIALVESAFGALERGADLALGPAEDGGFVLMALRPRSVLPRLFEAIPWSGPRVLETMLARAAEIGLTVELLESSRDVDTVDDLAALSARLAAADPGLCRATRRELARLGALAPLASEIAPCAS